MADPYPNRTLIPIAIAGALMTLCSPAVRAEVPSTITIQGTVQVDNGQAETGTHNYYLAFYTDAVGGTGLAQETGSLSVSDAGRFSFEYVVPEEVLSATEVWYALAVDVEGNGLDPSDLFPQRVRIHSVPFALLSADSESLGGRPARDYATDSELANGLAGVGPDNDWIFSGEDLLSAAAGSVGIGTDTLGAKLHVHQDRFEGSAFRVTTSATGIESYAAHLGGAQGVGLLAQSTRSHAARFEAGDVTGAARPAQTTRAGLVAIGEGRGIWASSATGSGLTGFSEENYGLFGQSTNYRGATGRTDRDDNNYGFFTFDNIYLLNFNTAGSKMQVVQNGGDQSLEKGEVVVFNGLGKILHKGGPPTPRVAQATEANSTGVAGVVYSRFNIEAVDESKDHPGHRGELAALEVTPDGPVAPGEYLLLVIQGPAEVKTESLGGSIEPGTLLSSCETPGCAGKAAEVSIAGKSLSLPGTVVGKALEPLESGGGMIYAFITLQ